MVLRPSVFGYKNYRNRWVFRRFRCYTNDRLFLNRWVFHYSDKKSLSFVPHFLVRCSFTTLHTTKVSYLYYQPFSQASDSSNTYSSQTHTPTHSWLTSIPFETEHHHPPNPSLKQNNKFFLNLRLFFVYCAVSKMFPISLHTPFVIQRNLSTSPSHYDRSH